MKPDWNVLIFIFFKFIKLINFERTNYKFFIFTNFKIKIKTPKQKIKQWVVEIQLKKILKNQSKKVPHMVQEVPINKLVWVAQDETYEAQR